MVRIGFIVEGDTEKIIIESRTFKTWAESKGVEIVAPVINAKGGGNLLPQNIEPIVMQVQRSNPNLIVILTDLEEETHVDAVRERIGLDHADMIFVAVKAIEAWFLADSGALQKWLGEPEVHESKPEETGGMPWDRLKELSSGLGKRGPGSNKLGFAKKMCNQYGFSIERAAEHPACPSAKFFHDKLIGFATTFPQIDI